MHIDDGHSVATPKTIVGSTPGAYETFPSDDKAYPSFSDVTLVFRTKFIISLGKGFVEKFITGTIRSEPRLVLQKRNGGSIEEVIHRKKTSGNSF